MTRLGLLALLMVVFGLSLTSQTPRFEVATIKRNVSGASGISDVFQPDGRYRALNMRLRDLIATAYRVRGFQVVGGPAWVASERFDVEAKAEDAAGRV